MSMQLKSVMKKVILLFCGLLPLKRQYIVFESCPELDGSPWMMYLALKSRGFEKKYKLVWLVDAGYYNIRSDVITIPFFGKCGLLKKLFGYMVIARAKVIVDSNRFVQKINPKTYRLYTQHGAPLKITYAYTYNLGEVDMLLSLSENMAFLEKSYYPSAEGKIVALGFPSNDRLFEYKDLKFFWEKLTNKEIKYKKIIGWLPTYRQHKKKSTLDSNIVFPFGVPLLKEDGDFAQLNDFLKAEDVLLVIQMHHAQAKNFPNQNYSNIVLVRQDLKQELNVSTADLMRNFDAMITDYSAAYYEYILLDRPVALSVDDFDDFSRNPGFGIDYFDWIKGVYLKTSSDLIHFVKDVTNDIDSARISRQTALSRIHKYVDNNSTQRVVDYLEKKVQL